MQEPGRMPPEELSRPKPAAKKKAASATKKAEADKAKAGFAGSLQSKKTARRNPKTEHFEHTDGSASESLPDSSSSFGGGDYRGLRHKYLLLEEEGLSLDRALSMVETEIKALENDKFELLDQLVVLEGLIDPSELKSKEN
ncbi:uncharacterized protein LOC110039260 isoform X2 [Phalaenopsis equestris]|nr:uncharacterized protein LOC110039260 isoform X2 [Phalaenopsis equestris]